MHLNPFNIVKAAKILGIVAQAIDKEIGGRIIAAQGDLIPMTFTLPGRRTRNVPYKVSDR